MNINGLNTKEVEINRKKYGTNRIESKSNNSFFKLLLESLGDPIIKILLIALAIKVVFLIKSFDWYETIGIVIAIFLASFISTVSEYGSERAFKRLQEEKLPKNEYLEYTHNPTVRSDKISYWYSEFMNK